MLEIFLKGNIFFKSNLEQLKHLINVKCIWCGIGGYFWPLNCFNVPPQYIICGINNSLINVYLKTEFKANFLYEIFNEITFIY